jgi:hypothetical protein
MDRDRVAVTAPTELDLSPDPPVKGNEGAASRYREVMGLENVGLG